VGVRREEGHLTFNIPTVGAMRVGVDELPGCEPMRCFLGRNSYVFAHSMFLSGLQDGAGFDERLDAVPAIFPANARVFESTPRRLRIVRHAVDHDPAGP
jgi:hypothetical protein